MPIAQWAVDDGPQKGPWFSAKYAGSKSCCDEDIEIGEDIRADGEGGWEGRCCEDIPTTRKPADKPKSKARVCPKCFVEALPGACLCDD